MAIKKPVTSKGGGLLHQIRADVRCFSYIKSETIAPTWVAFRGSLYASLLVTVEWICNVAVRTALLLINSVVRPL
jgi:hypothetical protein